MRSRRSRISGPGPTASLPASSRPSLARGEGYLGFARNGWQETLGVHMTSGEPEQLIVLSRATYLPLYTALATAAAVLAMLFQFYLLALAARARDRSACSSCRAGRRARPRLRPDAGRPRRQRAASYRGGRRAALAGADLHAGRRSAPCSRPCCSERSICGSPRRTGRPAAAPEPDPCLRSLPSRARRRRGGGARLAAISSPPAARRAAGSASPYSRSS